MFFSFLHHSGYGQDGPYANRGGYDVVAAALSGLIHITGPQVGSFTQVMGMSLLTALRKTPGLPI